MKWIFCILIIISVFSSSLANPTQIPPVKTDTTVWSTSNQNTVFQLQHDNFRQKMYKNIFFISALFLLLILISVIYIYNSKIRSVASHISIQTRELELKKFEINKLSIILNNTENSISIADMEGKILWINNGFSSLFGLNLDELENTPLANIFKITENTKLQHQIENARNSLETTIYSADYLQDNGNKIWYQRTLIPLLSGQEIAGFAAIDHDLTAVKIAMEQLTFQKHKVEEQKKRITDSINYASYIQSAVLPPHDTIGTILNNYFILFKPRDIVSGDFYWISKFENVVYVAVADCTGHGVPGAFMSMLGISLLNELIRDKNTTPAQVLNRLRSYIIKSLHQTGNEGEQKDGMDITLCKIDKQKQQIECAAANNPLYLITPKAQKNAVQFNSDKTRIHIVESEKELDYVLIEFKADKMPIGIFTGETKSFTNYKFNYQINDSIYMFSDGYPDQFGGDKGRKFLYKQLKELLLTNAHKTMSDQKTVLESTLSQWMHVKHNNAPKYEQVDDIVIFGHNLS